MSVIEVTKENFDEEVLKSEKTVIADFNADWCGPCKMLKPVLDELAAETDEFRIVSINIDDEDELAEQFDVSSIPCLVVFKGGEEVTRSIGIRTKDEIIGMTGGN